MSDITKTKGHKFLRTYVDVSAWIFLCNGLCQADYPCFCSTVVGLAYIAYQTNNWCYIDYPSLQPKKKKKKNDVKSTAEFLFYFIYPFIGIVSSQRVESIWSLSNWNLLFLVTSGNRATKHNFPLGVGEEMSCRFFSFIGDILHVSRIEIIEI